MVGGIAVMRLIRKLYQRFLCILSIISPTLNSKVSYYVKWKKKLNLSNPSTFKEKLIFLKLYVYNTDELVRKCADKWTVRQFIKDCGYEKYLIPLLTVYDSADQIDFSSLPDAFVLKWSFGAGYNIICNNKKKLNEDEARQQLKKWGKVKYHLFNGEYQYRNTKRRIVAEKFIGEVNGKAPDDYKIYCFNGIPKTIFVMTGRGGKMSTIFMTPDWEYIGSTDKYDAMDSNIEKPKVLSEMIEFAKGVSQYFPFVRVDVYVVNDRMYFGEMTFTPAGGIYCSEIDIEGKNMGDFLDIRKELGHV